MSKRWDNTWGSPVTAVRIPEPLRSAARDYARDQGQTISSLIKTLLEERLTMAGVDQKSVV